MANATTGKKAANLTVDAELLSEAKDLGINLSQSFERHLAELVRQAKGRRWLEENEQAIKDYDRHIETHGAWSDGLRRF